MSSTGSRRKYDSSARNAATAANRSRVLSAAGELFERNGYTATSIREIAESADVSAESVYGWFDSKADLLLRWVDVCVVGDEEPVALMSRPWVEAARAETDAAARRELVAANGLGEVLRRVAPAMRVFRAAAESDAYLAEAFAEGQKRRYADTEVVFDLLAGDGSATRPRAEAVDFLWALLGDQVYTALVNERGWSHQRYQNWMIEVVQVMLFDE